MNPQELFDGGIRQIQDAFQRMVSDLRAENAELRSQLKDRDDKLLVLQHRMDQQESTLDAEKQRVSSLMDEQKALIREKMTLTESVEGLKGQLAKLFAFKRSIIDSLSDADYHSGMTPPPTQGSSRLSHAPMTSGSFGAPTTDFSMRHLEVSAQPPSSRPITSTSPLRSPRRSLSFEEERRGLRSSTDTPQSAQGLLLRKLRKQLSYEMYSKLMQALRRLSSDDITHSEVVAVGEALFGAEHPELFDEFRIFIESL